jgi:uncharacterized protein YceK
MTKRALAGVVLPACLAWGCMTYDTRSDVSYDGPRVYSGTRLAASQAADQFMNLNLPWVMLFGIDLPFCLVADTLLLPWTIPEEIERREALRQSLQTADERPSVISIAPGTEPLTAARELFEECVERLQRYNPLLTDCFAHDARIFYHEGEPRMLTGAEYKPRIRAAVAEFQSRGEYVTWRRPRYLPLPDAERVRIEVDRSSSERGDLGKLELLVGPGPNGGWRIVELRGASWR